MSKQASKKNIAQNNETFVATLASGVLPNAVASENKFSDFANSVVKNKNIKKTKLERVVDEGEGLEQASIETPVFDELPEELALVDGVVEGDAELTLTQARSSDGAAAFFGADGWNVLGGVLLLGGVAALVGSGGGGGTATPVCDWEALEVTDEDLVLTADLNDVGDITVLATSADVDASLYTSSDVDIYLCDHGTDTNNLHLEASGTSSEIDVGISVVGNLDNIDVLASGSCSDVDFSMELTGNIDGDILVSSSSSDADSLLSIMVEGDINSSSIGIEATADESTAGAWIQVLGEVDVDSISVVAGSECAEINADADLYLGVSGDITVTNGISAVAYEGASADLLVGATGSVTASLEIDAIGEGSEVEFAALSGMQSFYMGGEDGFTESWTGNISLTASGLSSEISGEDGFVCADVFGDSGLTIFGSYLGDSINLTAEGQRSLIIDSSVNVIGGNVSSGTEEVLNIQQNATGENSAIVFSNINVLGGNLVADLNFTASGLDSTIISSVNVLSSDEISDSPASYTGNITLAAEGISSDITICADIDGDFLGTTSISASGDASDVNFSADIGGDYTGNLIVRAQGDAISSEIDYTAASVEVDIRVDGNFDGDISLSTSGFSSEVDLSAEIAGSFSGDVTLTATGQSSDLRMYVSVDADYQGDITVTATGDDSNIDLESDVMTTHTGNLTVTDKTVVGENITLGNDSYVEVDLRSEFGFFGDLDITAAAAGSDFYISIDVDHSSELIGEYDIESDVTVLASGQSTYVEVSLDTDGDYFGEHNLTASGISSDIEAEVDVDQNYSGDINLTASGNNASIELDVEVDHSPSLYRNSDDAYASVDLSGTYNHTNHMFSDITGTASGLNSELDIYIDVDAEPNLYGYSGDDIGTFNASAKYVGDINLTASGRNSSVDFGLYVSVDVELYSNELDSDSTQINASSLVSGDINATASGVSSEMDIRITVESEINAEGLNDNQTINSGNFIGDITLTASGTSSEISMDLWVDDDLTGNISFIASGEDAAVQAMGWGPSSNDIYIGGNFDGDLIGTASGSCSDVALSLDVGGDMLGDINIRASGNDSEAWLCADVIGDINGDISLRADTSAIGVVNSGSDIYADVTAADINGDIYIESSNRFGNANVNLYIDVQTSSDISYEELVGDIFITGGYENYVNLEFREAFSGLIDMTGVSGRNEIEDSANMFYGIFDLDIYSPDLGDSDFSDYTYWYNWANPISSEEFDAHNRYMNIEGFTGMSADMDRQNNLDFIEFHSFGYERYISQNFANDELDGNYWVDLHVHEEDGFADLASFLSSAWDILSGGTDVWNLDENSDLDYDAVQYYTGTITGDDAMYLAVGSDMQGESGISYLIRFDEFNADMSAFEYQLINTQPYELT